MDRLRTIRSFAWVATGIAVLACLAYAASYRWWVARDDGGGRVVAFSRGRWVTTTWVPTMSPRTLKPGEWTAGRDPGTFPWWQGLAPPPLSVRTETTAVLPLTIGAAVGLWGLWLHGTRKARRIGACRVCEYDLRGLPRGSPCPECGAAPPSRPA